LGKVGKIEYEVIVQPKVGSDSVHFAPHLHSNIKTDGVDLQLELLNGPKSVIHSPNDFGKTV
jgi:hypothetical protein